MLTKKEFDILAVAEQCQRESLSAAHKNVAGSSKKHLSQREFARRVNLSVGSVNSTMMLLKEKKLFDMDSGITKKGLAELEPYRVKRVVFIAAGFGTRLVPITLNTPKPLVRVKGTRIIDTMLDAVLAAGITDITIVRGYLSEQFDQLLYKYPMIKFVENPAYNEANNISSAMCVRYLIGGGIFVKLICF